MRRRTPIVALALFALAVVGTAGRCRQRLPLTVEQDLFDDGEESALSQQRSPGGRGH